MRIKSILIVALGCAFSMNTMANVPGSYKEFYPPVQESHPWSIVAGIGYTWYNFGYDGDNSDDSNVEHAIGDGETPIGRFAIARDFGSFTEILRFGAEFGIQNGNSMRLDISQDELDLLGGLPVEVNIKPMLDLLVTATTIPFATTPAPVFAVLKAGIAYRRMTVEDRVTVNDLSQVAFEVQAGFGVYLSEQLNMSLVYQGIFDGGTDFYVDTVTNTGDISNIPNQDGILLNLSYKL